MLPQNLLDFRHGRTIPNFLNRISKTFLILFNGPHSTVGYMSGYSCLTADPGVASKILAWSHTFVEIDHEIISMVILLASTESFKEGCCQLQAEVCHEVLVNLLFKLAQEKVWLGELTVQQ